MFKIYLLSVVMVCALILCCALIATIITFVDRLLAPLTCRRPMPDQEFDRGRCTWNCDWCDHVSTLRDRHTETPYRD
jgi:hypothetical protein